MTELAKLVCFDLDDTLIRHVHSVMFLCILNGKLDELLEIEKLEDAGKWSWIEADYHKAELARGLPQERIPEEFDRILRPLENIQSVVDALHDRSMSCIVVTAGPRQVAAAVKERWGFDESYGSDYETVDGAFTGKIIKHIGDVGKISCLRKYCRENGIRKEECIAVGDGYTDIPLFEYCGRSIAINATPLARAKATDHCETNDLRDLLPFLLKE